MLFIVTCAGLLAVVLVGVSFAAPLVFRPRPIDDILYNPHMGFQTFQHFNGDPLFPERWTECGPTEFGPRPDSLDNGPHPHTTVSYCRWYWDTIEPADGEFRWDIIDGALETARDRGQTLAIRVMCHDSHGVNDVPKWFKACGASGAMAKLHKGEPRWLPDYADPLYIKHWTRVNRELAKRYDGHPDLDTVDLASIGPWGEWDARPVDPGKAAKRALIECYTDVFKKTPLLMQFDDAWSMRCGVERGTGWRADCLGDMRFKRRGDHDWCHMHDLYPQGIIYGGAQETWRTAPVVFEVCGVLGSWHKEGFDADYIFNEAIKWHMSQFNTKSSAVPEDYQPSVDRCLKRMGYRFVCRKFATEPKVRRGAMMRFFSWWENRGCAPIYHHYDLALRFKSGGQEFVTKTDADLTRWLPGDSLYDGAVSVPRNVPTGKCEIAVAMLHRISGKPAIELAQDGRGEDGWYTLGEIEIVDTHAQTDKVDWPEAP